MLCRLSMSQRSLYLTGACRSGESLCSWAETFFQPACFCLTRNDTASVSVLFLDFCNVYTCRCVSTMSYSWEWIERKQINPKTVDPVCMCLFLNGFVKSSGWQIFFFFLSCVHVSTIVNILFVPKEVTKTVSYSFSLRPLSTRQSIYVNVWVSLCVHIYVCVFIGVGQLRVHLALSK